MTRPWARIEDLFEPLPEDPAPASSPADEAVQRFGFDAVYAEVLRVADEAQDRLNRQEGNR